MHIYQGGSKVTVSQKIRAAIETAIDHGMTYDEIVAMVKTLTRLAEEARRP